MQESTHTQFSAVLYRTSLRHCNAGTIIRCTDIYTSSSAPLKSMSKPQLPSVVKNWDLSEQNCNYKLQAQNTRSAYGCDENSALCLIFLHIVLAVNYGTCLRVNHAQFCIHLCVIHNNFLLYSWSRRALQWLK